MIISRKILGDNKNPWPCDKNLKKLQHFKEKWLKVLKHREVHRGINKIHAAKYLNIHYLCLCSGKLTKPRFLLICYTRLQRLGKLVTMTKVMQSMQRNRETKGTLSKK